MCTKQCSHHQNHLEFRVKAQFRNADGFYKLKKIYCKMQISISMIVRVNIYLCVKNIAFLAVRCSFDEFLTQKFISVQIFVYFGSLVF